MRIKKHKEIETFDEFVSIEMKKFKKDHPDAVFLTNVTVVDEIDEVPIEKEEITEESEIEHIPEDIVDESVE